jgi:hypothetical protein
MRTAAWISALLFLGCAPCPSAAQQISSRGQIRRIDLGGGQVILRKYKGDQRVFLTPDTEVTVNGREGMLGEVMVDAQVELLGYRDRAGRLHAESLVIRQPSTPTRLAADGPDTIRGEVAGFAPRTRTLAVRTAEDVVEVPVGSTPVMLGGRKLNVYDLALGDRVVIPRMLPSGTTRLVPNVILVVTPQKVAGLRETFRDTMPAPGDRAR